jgi:putative acetyltransferase
MREDPCEIWEAKQVIREANGDDVSRIAEIRVFVNRVKFWPIFQEAAYSFGEPQVLSVAKRYADPATLANIHVYEDGGIVKGFIHVEGEELVTLYVDSFFWGQSIGTAFIEFAKKSTRATFLWALEKNASAIRFYERHSFRRTGDRKFEEGTTEYLVKMARGA